MKEYMIKVMLPEGEYCEEKGNKCPFRSYTTPYGPACKFLRRSLHWTGKAWQKHPDCPAYPGKEGK